jgi:molybdopterin-guanine dinucleotide biosynthesis protein A
VVTRAFVLAGGRSSRFGSDKALWAIGGVPMTLRVARALLRAGLDVRIVGRQRRGLPIVEEIEPEGPLHPLWGVAQALRHGDAFVAPCDVPDLTPAQVRALLQAGARASANPLVGVFRAADRDAIVRLALASAPVHGLPGLHLDIGPITNLNQRPARPP